MARTILWGLAFSPMLVMLFLPSGERWAGLATALGVIQLPILIAAAFGEYLLLRRRGTHPAAVSKGGNFIAIILGLAILLTLVTLWALARR